MLILFNNSFHLLIMSSERPIKSSERVIMSSEQLIESSERLSMSSERLIMSSRRVIYSSERLIFCRRNDLLTRRNDLSCRRNDLLCCNASLSHSPTRNGCPRPHQACNDSTPAHLVISIAESLGHTSCDALATAPEPQRDWGWRHIHPTSHPPKKDFLFNRKFLVDNFLIEVTCYCELSPDIEQTCM